MIKAEWTKADALDLQPTCNEVATDTISRRALCEYALNQKDKTITANDIMRFPSAQPKSYREGYQAGYKDAQPESAKRTAETAQNVSDEDLISRKAAIDAIRASTSKYTGFMEMEMYTDDDAVEAIEALPPAQPAPEEFEWCRDCKEYDQDAHCCHRWAKAIRKTVSELEETWPKQLWIPVTERMPENSEEVLITYIVNGNKNKRYTEMATYYDGDNGFWASPWDEYRVAGTRIDVIAWMPLPEPYKEDEPE